MATIKFESWDYLLDLFKLFKEHRFIIIGKARQLGITTLLAIYATWRAKFFENAKVLMISKQEEKAFDIIDKCKFIDDNLPDFLHGSGRNPDQRGLIRFIDTKSDIEALASTEDAGRSGDATLVVADEWEYHKYAEINYGALRPTISNNGQFIALSTANPTVTVDKSFFKAIYRGAIAGDNGFKRFFIPWDARPERDEEWLERESQGMPAWMKKAEFPATENDMLETIKTQPFFDNAILEEWKRDALSPIKSELSDQFKTVTVFKEPVVGRRYVQFADPSDGADDPHFIVTRDAVSGEWVAVSHAKTKADYAAQIHDAMVRYYNDAFNGNEVNAKAGGIFDAKLEDLGTPNRAFRVKADRTLDLKKHGWHTSAALRDWMEQSLEEAVRLQKVRIYYKPGLDEMIAYMRPEGEDPVAPKGGHDDVIFGGGGCECLMNYLPQTREITISSGHYKESR